MQVARIGEFEVRRITEFEGPFIAPETPWLDFDPEVLLANPDLAGPRPIGPATGRLVFSFHSFVVRTRHHTILTSIRPRQRWGATDPAATPSAAQQLSCRPGRGRGLLGDC